MGVTRVLMLMSVIFFFVMHCITDMRRPNIVKHDGGIYIQFGGKDFAKITSVEIVGE